MNGTRRVVALTACLITIFSAASVGAQEAVDTQALETVTTAFADTLAVSSLHVEARTQTESGGITGGVTQQGTAGYDLLETENGWNLAGSGTTVLSSPNGEVSSTTEMVIVDGVVYLRLNQGQMAPVGDQSQLFPEGWFNASELTASDQPMGMMFGDAESLTATALGGLLLPVSAESVTGLAELDADTIDGQAMRVFQITVDPAAVLESSAASLLRGGAGRAGAFGGMGGGRGQDGQPPQPPGDESGAPPGDFQGTPPAEFRGEPPVGSLGMNPDNIQIVFAVWIGEDDGYIHRVYTIIGTQSGSDAGEAQTTSTVSTVTDFSAFNEPVEIILPDLGS